MKRWWWWPCNPHEICCVRSMGCWGRPLDRVLNAWALGVPVGVAETMDARRTALRRTDVQEVGGRMVNMTVEDIPVFGRKGMRGKKVKRKARSRLRLLVLQIMLCTNKE